MDNAMFKIFLAFCLAVLLCQTQVSGSELGAQCTNNTNCTVENSECVGDPKKCQCQDGFYQENSTSCQPKKGLGEGCSNTTECLNDNAECSGDKCTCVENFYKNGTACLQ
ncbi:unnamed protein product, partial [Owenia fusiformis]